MSYYDFYIQPSGNNLNSGSTVDNAAAHTYASGTWVASTGVFTLASGNPSSDGVVVGDWASVYADGASVTPFIGQVTAVDSTTITVSLAVKFGTAPTDGTSNRTVKIGGAFASLAITASGTPFNTGSVPGATRVNIKAATYANTTTARTLGIVGTSAYPLWLRGYKTTPGDLDTESSVPLTPGTDMPFITFTGTSASLTCTGPIMMSNVAVQAAANGPVFVNGLSIIYRCWFENTNAGSSAVRTIADATNSLYIKCYFKIPTAAAATANLAFSVQGFSVLYCVIENGAIGITGASSCREIIGNTFIGEGSGTAISTPATSAGCIAGNTFYGWEYAIRFTAGPTTLQNIYNNAAENCTTFLDNASNADVGTYLVSMYNNAFYNVTNVTTGLTDLPVFMSQTGGASLFVDASSRDFTPSSDSVAGHTGAPGLLQGLSILGRPDIGAVQRASSGSSGMLVHPGTNGGIRG